MSEKNKKFEFYSSTYPEDGWEKCPEDELPLWDNILFVITIESEDIEEGESEEFVEPLLKDKWELSSEDTWEYRQNTEITVKENFQIAKQKLIELGFIYKGGIDDEAFV
jgi:hypothetical protein